MTCKKVLRAQRIALENRLPLVYLVDSRRRLPAAAGRGLSRRGRFRPHLPQQRRHLRGGHSAVRGHHGQLRRRRRLSAGAVRQAADDRGQRPVPGRPGPGQGGHRPDGQPRGPRRRDDARRRQRHHRLPRAGRCRLPGAPAPPGRAAAGRRAARRPMPRAGPARRRPARRSSRPIRGRNTTSATCLPCILDAGPFDEYKAEYGQTLVCGYGRLGGVPVGVVANQRKRCKPATGPLQFGGVIYVDSADKAARFIMDCNQTRRAAPVPAGRQRLHGRPRFGAGRHHPGRGQAGQRHRQQRGAEDHA